MKTYLLDSIYPLLNNLLIKKLSLLLLGVSSAPTLHTYEPRQVILLLPATPDRTPCILGGSCAQCLLGMPTPRGSRDREESELPALEPHDLTPRDGLEGPPCTEWDWPLEAQSSFTNAGASGPQPKNLCIF